MSTPNGLYNELLARAMTAYRYGKMQPLQICSSMRRPKNYRIKVRLAEPRGFP